MTGATCIGEPVSWLRLEQLALGELAAPAVDAVTAHLGACPACTACLDQIRGDQIALPALPALPERKLPWWKRRITWAIAGTLAAAAAAVFLFLRMPGATEADVGPTIRLKGGDVLVVGLVRERAGVTQLAPTTFAPGDRFKVTVTCSQAAEVWADIVVFQPNPWPTLKTDPMIPSYPAAPVVLTCGNNVALPGAFTITGPGPASVCLAIDVDHAPTREPLGRRKGVACYQLREEPAGAR